MPPRQKQSLRTQLLLSVVTIVLLGFAITFTVLTVQASRLQQEQANQYAQELARRQAAQVSATLDEAMQSARVVAHALGELRASGQASRQMANAILQGVLAGNPRLLGVWSGWEPNAFDGQDAAFAGQTGHDQTGRFIPYWNRGSGQIGVEPLVDYDKPGNGDYYLLAKQGGREVLIEPYMYPIAGKNTLITTVTVPIVLQGQFVGVAGVDIALASLQEMVGKIRVFDTGRASLVSTRGPYVGHADASKVGQAMEQGGAWDGVRQAIRAGQATSIETEDADQGTVTQLYVPVQVGQASTPWAFMAQVPHDKIEAGVRQLVLGAVALARRSGGVVRAVLSYALSRLVLHPLGGDPAQAVDMVNRVAQGDLTVTVDTRRAAPGSLMAQLAHMQQRLASVVLDVRQGADSVASASVQIAQGNLDLSVRTENQANALGETTEAMTQLGNTVHHNTDTAQEANRLAQNASRIAREGGEVVGQVVHTIRDINHSSQKIADIISVIDGIAFQTNILALNAAVEAARAGEQGRGFAVVATEVRNLAQRSAEAAKQITTLIQASVERVSAGTALVDQAGHTMEQVVDAIQRVTDLMGQISAASGEQNQSVQQIGNVIGNMDASTQQNAALVEEMATAAERLKEQARELVTSVQVFRLDATTKG